MSDETEELEDGWEVAASIIKAGTAFMTGFGVSALVRGATQTIPTSSYLPMKLCVIVAKLGITSAITVAVDNNNDKKIDSAINSIRAAKKVKDLVKEAKDNKNQEEG